MKSFVFRLGLFVLIVGAIGDFARDTGGIAVAGGLIIVAAAIWHLADSLSYALGAMTGLRAQILRKEPADEEA